MLGEIEIYIQKRELKNNNKIDKNNDKIERKYSEQEKQKFSKLFN